MRCNNCPALCVEGYEYPEEYCSILAEDDPRMREFADGEYGCLLRKATIEKMVAENEAAFAEHCESMGKWYVQTEEIEGDPEMLAECVAILREISSDSKAKIESDFKALKKLVYCKFVVDEIIFDTNEEFCFTITEAGEQWLNKYADYDLFDVEFVVYGWTKGEDDYIGMRIDCNGAIDSPDGGYALKDGRAGYSVLAKTPQEALSIAEKLFYEEDFFDLIIEDARLEHIYQASTEQYYYSEDL